MRVILLIIVFSVFMVGCDWTTFADDIDRAVDEYNDDTDTNTTNTSTIREIRQIQFGSWYVDDFGQAKMREQAIVSFIQNTIFEYDVLAFQGITDATQESFTRLMNDLDEYEYVLSERQGRDENKEQYAYIYRDDYIELIDDTSYPDDNNYFEYDPYISHYRIGDYDFLMIQVHTKNTDATYEIRKLAEVYEYAIDRYEIEDVIILGNLNADCAYFNTEELEDFYWLIDESIDTTTTSSDCAYDRIIVSSTIEDDVLHADVYSLDGFSPDLIDATSSHYPIYGILSVPTIEVRE